MGDILFVPEKLSEIGKQIKNRDKPKAFSDGFKDVDEVVKAISRDEEVQALKKMSDTEHTSAEKTKEKTKAEVLSGCERDIRARYQGRLQAYIAGTDVPELTKAYAQYHQKQIGNLTA